jgi:hypothetical protein
VAAKHGRTDEDKIQIELDIEQHLGQESDFNILKMHLLNNYSDHIHPLGNLINASCALPEKAMTDLKQTYRQLNGHEATFQRLRTCAQQEVFHYRDLNEIAAIECCDDDIPLLNRLSSK